MPFDPTAEDDQAQAITRLVDNTLSDAERPAIEAWASEHPEIKQQIATERGVADALSHGGPEPPARLVGAVRDRVRASERRKTRLTVPAWLGNLTRRPAFAGAALVAVCAVVAIVVVGVVSGTNSPSIPAAAKLAFAPSTGAAPGVKSPTLLNVTYAGITYPNYGPQFAVYASGLRTDKIGGRPALTVFYRLPNGHRLSYTVFSGAPVRLPRAAREVVFQGVPLHTFTTSSGLAVVTLVRFGRTCVLAAPTRRDIVLALAAAPIREQAA